MKTTIIKLHPEKPDAEQIRQIALSILEGKMVAFPTETVYGIGAPASQTDSIEKIYDLKRRPQEKVLSYHIADIGATEKLGIRSSGVFRFFRKLFWPGPVTLLVWNEREEKIGIRFPKHEVATRLIRQCGEAFLATSANLSGEASPKTADDVMRNFPDQIDIVVDSGKCQYAEDSTVVDLTVTPPKILRKGALASAVEDAIGKVASGKYPRKKILMVCTGNTCRSPMAEVWLKAQFKKKGTLEQFEVSSCGIMARDGGVSSMEVELVLRNDEISLGNFRSRLCRREDVMESDMIFVMTEQHAQYISSMCPQASGRIVNLDVDDPMGMSIHAYEVSYKEIKQKLSKYWNDIVK